MAAFEPKRLTDYSVESIIAEIQRVASLFPGEGVIIVADFMKLARMSRETITKHFGSVEAGFVAAGIGHRYNKSRINSRISKRPIRGRTDEDLIAELRSVAKTLGRSCFTQVECDEVSQFRATSIASRFKGWKNAMKKGGLDVSPTGKRYTDEECYENLLNVWLHYGRQPNYDEMDESPSLIPAGTYKHRWKRWTKAVHAFVGRMNNDAEEVEESVTSETHERPSESDGTPKRKSVPVEDRRKVPPGLRWKVASRDGLAL